MRPSDGGEAPLTQLAGLVVELERDHPDMLPALAAWFAANGPRVSNALNGYVVRAQVVTNLSRLNVGTYLQAWAVKNNIDTGADVDAAKLADFLQKAFVSPDYNPWVASMLPAVNRAAFGEKNAGFLANSTLAADIAALYAAPEISAFASAVIPDGQTQPLATAIKKYSNKHRTDALQVTYGGKKQSVEKHLGDFWVAAVKKNLGEPVVLNYVISLLQTLATQMANDFRDKNQPIAEWYFNSPYGSPATTEMLVGYAIKELDLLSKYYKHKDWLMNGFTNEVFQNEDDKRAFRLLLDQVPNIVTYVRSGMARSGGDLTRAMAKDTNGYLVKSYVGLIVKATETGWVRKGVRLLEAYHATPDYKRHFRAPMSDDIDDRADYKQGVEAMERILRSLITPAVHNDYSTTTLSRVLVPLGSIVGDGRRAETERFLLTSADEVLKLSDQQINDFFKTLHTAKPPGEASDRRASYKSVADMMRNPHCPEVVDHVAGLFRDNAVKPALDFLARNIDDGTLGKLLVFIRRVLKLGE
ncbi:hypothetical protein FACS189487_10730 [Campylobacterota bacterium]|nr:hypothetical protein FACS189487_10730 [Campylobacterota bacterium]